MEPTCAKLYYRNNANVHQLMNAEIKCVPYDGIFFDNKKKYNNLNEPYKQLL